MEAFRHNYDSPRRKCHFARIWNAYRFVIVNIFNLFQVSKKRSAKMCLSFVVQKKIRPIKIWIYAFAKKKTVCQINICNLCQWVAKIVFNRFSPHTQKTPAQSIIRRLVYKWVDFKVKIVFSVDSHSIVVINF